MRRKVCVIGLGSMGLGAAQSLLRSGFDVCGVDVRSDTLAHFERKGGRTAKSPALGAKDAEIAFIFVVNDKQVDDVLFGKNGVVQTIAKGGVIVGCATVPPIFAETLESRLTEAGLEYVDAPVSGGSVKAAAGEMTVMASGKTEVLDRAAPFFDAIATKVYRLGSQAGIGSKFKMINQLLAGVHIAAAAEAVALGIRCGLDPKLLYEVISNSAGSSWMFQNRVPHILEGNYQPNSAVDIFVKDLGIVLDTGRKNELSLPVATAAHSIYRKANANGLGAEDDSAVVKVYAAEGGIELPRQKE